MRTSRCAPFALAGLLLATLRGRVAFATPPDPESPEEARSDSFADAGALRPAAAHCAFSGAADPDGAAARLAASRATRLFAAAHPAGTVGSGSGPAPLRRLAHVNFVDDEVLGKMERDGIPYAPLSSDTEFLRRVTLDLTGRIPDAAAVAAFAADHSPDKRARTIEALLAAPEFDDRWALFYDDLLKDTAFPDSGRLGTNGRNAWHAWILGALRAHQGWDRTARELIAATGDNVAQNAAGNYEVRNIQTNGPVQDTYDNLAATTGSVFLGLNAVFCTSCHNGSGHLDSINLWGAGIKRQDFWGMSAFFARTGYVRAGAQPNFTFNVTERPAGDYALNTTTGNKTVRVACKTSTEGNCWMTDPLGLTTVTPKFVLNGGKPNAGEGYRQALARLVTSDPQFAKASANYVWKELFTTGIVDPPDSFDLARQDPSSPPPQPWAIQPTHPQLLVELGQAFAASGYDLRALLRIVCNSSAYQLSSFYPGTWQDAYAPYLARHLVRRLGAEMLLDAITKATGVPITLPVAGYAAPVSRAVQLPDVATEPGNRATRAFLDVFLRGDRDTDPRSYQGSITQALSAMNDTIVTSRVKATAAGSTLNRLLAANATNTALVTQLYLATLSRFPTDAELASATALLAAPPAGETRTQAAEDLQWALLNKLDFLFKY